MESDDIISSAIEKCTADDNRDKYELALESKRDCVQAKLEIILCSTPKTDIVRLNSRTRHNVLANFLSRIAQIHRVQKFQSSRNLT